MDQVQTGLPPIPAKRYFTIGEVSELCLVKPYVLRYWEQEFVQLKPMKRRGNRRYYQHHEVLLIRRIRELLYDQGFTISGARNQLTEHAGKAVAPVIDADVIDDDDLIDGDVAVAVLQAAKLHEGRVAARALQSSAVAAATADAGWNTLEKAFGQLDAQSAHALRDALLEIRDLLA